MVSNAMSGVKRPVLSGRERGQPWDQRTGMDGEEEKMKEEGQNTDKS